MNINAAAFLIYADCKMFVLSRNFSKLFVGNRRCCHTSENGKPESFSKSRIGNFFQEQPAISNPFMSDTFLQRYMKTLLPENVSILYLALCARKKWPPHSLV